MKRERFKAVPAVYLFICKEGDILLTRRCNTGYEDGKYMVPSGHVEDGEPLREAAARETMEEVGLAVRPEDLRLVHVMYRAPHDSTGARADFFFTTEQYDGEARNMEPDKCDEVGWFPAARLPDNTVAYLRAAIEASQRGDVLTEWGWERGNNKNTA